MYVDHGDCVLSPTDLTKHLACPHLTTLDLAAARGEISPPEQHDESLELIFRLGLDHERAYVQALRDAGKDVAEIPETDVDIDERVRLTEEALRAGAEVVYQATFLHGGHRGHADFLVREDRPSLLGNYSYDVADTKLARKMKVAALLQMADYGRHLERIQGHPPEWLTVVTGDGAERRFRYADAAAYAERATTKLRNAVEEPTATRPEPTAHCPQCRWSPRCEAQWRREDHLSAVAFMRADHRAALENSGVRTVRELAASDPAGLSHEIGEAARNRLQAQAELQVLERETGSPHYEVLQTEPGLGLLRLPTPSTGDVYLDFEGDPYADGEGREYLAGLWDRRGVYTAYWAHSAEEERAMTAALLAELLGRLRVDPGMHIYHYAPYERSALARLTQRHGVGERNFDRLLRGETFVDLYAVVRQGLRISKGSYSIKKLEAFYWGGVRGSGDQPDDVADALASVVAYEKWLVHKDDSILANIAAYNRDDVRSTHDLHSWLEERRAELEDSSSEQPRPSIPVGTPSEALSDAESAEAELVEQLDAAGHPLLAGLVGWHRRENKPQWWDFYRLSDLTDDELINDGAAIGALSGPELIGPLPSPARSTIWRYSFPPQETKVSSEAFDVDTHKSLGRIDSIDAAAGWLKLRVGNTREPPTPRGLGSQPPVRVDELQRSLQRTASEVLGGASPLGQRLLRRVVPKDLTARPDETPKDVAVRVGRTLHGAVLAVQGPPGTGKTYAGAELIRALLDDGLRVGVTAQSHAVVGNLLTKVGRRGLQKCDADQHCGAPGVDQTSENKVIVAGLSAGEYTLVGGSAWLWSREEMTAMVDVLVIDEAGQFSLADAVAVSRAARGLVLLGDPQQIMQPSQAQHPAGAGVSALDHLLDGHATIPADRGVFLDRTWRMHPDLTSVVSDLMYEGRLGSVPATADQELRAPAPWGGTGVRWVPVPHTGNAAASPEEAVRVGDIVADLIGSEWVDCDGAVRRVGAEDVLVVAPYNAQVGRLRAVLPPGISVGTVDKFQGREAPVVIYSMTSSSVEDAPRGVGFLYDLHRLNVAISRARCVAVIVGSPALLDASVRTPEQLAAVNGLIKVVGSGRG